MCIIVYYRVLSCIIVPIPSLRVSTSFKVRNERDLVPVVQIVVSRSALSGPGMTGLMHRHVGGLLLYICKLKGLIYGHRNG